MQLPSFISIARAADFITPVGTADPKGNGAELTNTISIATNNVVAVLFTLGGALGVIYLLWCGIQYITAGGNQDKVKTARQGIINAVLGIIIMMTAWFIIRLAVSAGLFAATATDAVKKP